MASGDLQKRRTTYPPTQTDKATIVSPIVSRYFWNTGGSKLVVQYRPGEIHPKRREMECGRRPNRSDVHLPVEEEAKIEEKTREYFDGLAPKRHSKPNRSDYSSRYVDGFANSDDFNGTNPEQVEFQRLQDDPQVLLSVLLVPDFSHLLFIRTIVALCLVFQQVHRLAVCTFFRNFFRLKYFLVI